MENRWRAIPSEQRDVLLQGCKPSELSAEEALFLALHVRSRFLDRIGLATTKYEQEAWTDTIAAAFASLLQHCDLDDLDRVYHLNRPWNDLVFPPSVLACELMMFLGALSVANADVSAMINKRGSIQAYLRLLDRHKIFFDEGRIERQRMNHDGRM